MEAEKVLIERIIAITALIKEKHPELVQFLDEMPVTIPNEKDPHLNLKALKEYSDSLTDLLKKYEVEHPF
ncbi:MAG: hypothetical protein V4677_15285 [Bacteroidota bacterium]